MYKPYEIQARRNTKTKGWEVYSLVLQGWTVAENIYQNFDEQDVKDYYAGFGRLVHFCSMS